MVSDLKHYARDPMYPKLNRGAGLYYFRGDLARGTIRGHVGPYWSKYSESIDAKKAHKRHRTTNIGKSEEKQPHKADYKTRMRGGRVDTHHKSTRTGTGPRGYF